MTTSLRRRARLTAAGVSAAATAIMLSLGAALPANAAGYERFSGEGSSWAGNAWADFAANAQRQGVTVDYSPNGSSQGRADFAAQNNATFAQSEIPFTGDSADPSDTSVPNFRYGLLPIVAGGTAFMYNLPVDGSPYQNLNLTQAAIAGIFSGTITYWDDATIKKTNPGVNLPHHLIDVVVRSDGSGATAQFKLWMLRQFPQQYAALANATGGNPKAASSYFPTGSLKNFIAQNGSTGVTTYTQNTPYTIDYDEYSYALAAGFPVAGVQNAAGYFTKPTQNAVAVALIAAKINSDPKSTNYLSQDLSKVYTYGDPRAYPMSMYSYMIVPNEVTNVTSKSKGASLAWVTTQALCEWQRDMGPLGYSPLPMNLVLAALDQVLKIPGVDASTKASISATQKGTTNGGANPCNNPTFQPGDDPAHNLLVDSAAFPTGCDAACQAPWKTASTPSSGPKTSTGGGTTATGGSTSGSGSSGSGSSGSSSGSGSGTSTGAATGGTATDGGSGTTGGGTTGQTCDADTGVCSDGSGTGSTVDAANTAQVVPTTIGGDGGWTSTQTLGLIVVILMFALLIATPAIVVGRGPGRRKG